MRITRIALKVFLLVTSIELISCNPKYGSVSSKRLEPAMHCLETNDTLGACNVLRKMIHKNENDPRAFALLGSIYRSRNTIEGRLSSQKILERGRQLFPNDPGILFELGKTYYAQGFYPDASHCFYDVLKLEPGNCTCIFYLAKNYFRKWKRNRGYKDELKNARQFFGKALSCNPKEVDWRLYLAFIDYALGDTLSCRKQCSMVLKRRPKDPNALFLAGVLDFENRKYPRALKNFQTALDQLPQGKRDYYTNISYLLNAKTREEYKALSPAGKERIESRYWAKHDPDPTTSINERYLEHIYRKILAFLYFSDWDSKTPYGLTDRGIALIKFGWPTETKFSLEDGLSGRSEQWTYVEGDEISEFTFLDEFLNDRFSIPARNGGMKYRLEEMQARSTLAYLNNLPGRINIYSFKNESSNMDVFILSAFNGLYRPNHLKKFKDGVLYLRWTLFDTEWKKLEQLKEESITFSLTDSTRSNICRIQEFSVPFGDYNVAVAADDSSSGLRAVLKGGIAGVKFLGDSLMLSDIILHKADSNSSCNISIRRGRTIIKPAPYPDFAPGENLGVYFEIYNLKFKGLRTSYETSFLIYDLPGGNITSWDRISSSFKRALGLARRKPPAITQTIPHSGAKHSESDDIIIDIRALKPGRYELRISVMDIISGERCESSVIFYKTT